MSMGPKICITALSKSFKTAVGGEIINSFYGVKFTVTGLFWRKRKE
ncbi:hypothetical protein RintRC_4713 [Richelia intracellularis]|nr:hypothetical protein RintRC_4713 [Richelia intracellularis]